MPARALNVALLGLLALLPGVLHGGAAGATQDRKPVPSSSALDRLVKDYLAADEARRAELRADCDRKYLPPRLDRNFERAVERFRKLAAGAGPRLERKGGTHYFYEDGDSRRGKYILRPASGDTLFVGLHGGGLGEGDAASMASGMGGGDDWVWIFPEVLEKTEHGWRDSGTDRFVLELVEAAKRTFRLDPNRIFVTGHSMGGYGTWCYAAQHADVFAGGAAYAGAPTPILRSPQDPTIVDLEAGLLPNLYRQNFLFFQSGDDPRVPPGPNDFAAEQLARWKEWFPDGYNYRYERVEGRGHAAPAEGYLPTQEWLASHSRDPLPRRFLWQPTLPWKKQFFWLVWHEPRLGSLLHLTADDDNHIQIDLLDPEHPSAPPRTAAPDPGALTLFLKAPVVDLQREVQISVNGLPRFRGMVEPTLSTLLWTLPKQDADLLFTARVDLNAP